MTADASGNPHLWQKAASLAARFHVNQARKDGRTPYVAHPFRVAIVVSNVFNVHDPVVLSAALLHDVIEDTPADYDDVFYACGTEVADIVAAMTKDMRLPDAEREPAYDRQLAAGDWRVKIVKLADVYDNLCDSTPGGQRERCIDKAHRAVNIALEDGDKRLVDPIARLNDLINEFAGAPVHN
ncbi:MAG: bifunctional (p)ppGpp synthetase/guanosine-3',5'-bis(diphosphate) 3'-pyrophosphohydrolase [Phycisphaerales bacterium]|nr:bifunctional (p)ppGpp synthetase/guanosine-3',5'-bis(diphosphate) 3'-pyrophosphohydrolase [Phycisphaerales bacterium]